MYSPKVTERQLLRIQRKLKRDLILYDIDATRNWTEYLNKKYDYEKKEVVGKITDEDCAFIENQQILCQVDFRYWATNYCYILHWDKSGPCLFTFNVAQNIVLDIISEHEELKKAIMLMQLKARQLGISTLTEAIVCHRSQFVPYTSSVVASSDPEKTKKMHEMIDLMIKKQPWWLLPKYTFREAGELAYDFTGIESSITRQHGTQKSGISRGSTPNVVHLSEVASYTNPESLVEASLLNTIHENPRVFVMLESTAEGEDNWWCRTYNFSRENYDLGMSRLRANFLGWFVGSDIYPPKYWAQERREQIAKFVPPEHIENHARRCEETATTDPLLKKYFPEGWKMPIEQKYFYYVEHNEAKAKKTLNFFYQERPANADDAFQTPHNSVFDSETIMEMKERTRRPEAIFAITSDDLNEIPLQFHPTAAEIDRRMKPFPLTVHWSNHDKPRQYKLVPIRWEGYDKFKPYGKLLIWEWPEDGEEYGAGIDLSFGIGEDSSVIEVIRKGSFTRRQAQVAEFFSPWMNAEDMIPHSMVVCTLYSTIVRNKRRQCKVGIEIRAADGTTTQRGMQKLGWWNFHVRQQEDSVDFAPNTNLRGWATDERTRKKIIGRLLSVVKYAETDIRSPYLVQSIANLQRNEDTGKIAAFGGRHDDHAMSFGIIEASLDMELMPGDRETKYRKRKQVEDAQKQLPQRQLTSQEIAPNRGDPIWKNVMKMQAGKMKSKVEKYLINP